MGEAAQVPWDKVISAAAASTLGVLSLSVILVGVLAYLFFGRSDDRVKLWVFGAVLLAVVGLAVAVLRESQGAAPPGPAPTGAPPPSAAPSAPTASPSPLVGGASASPDAPPSTPSPSPVARAYSLDGVWTESDGYSYRVTSSGARYAFQQFFQGQLVGSGEGTVNGRIIEHTFVSASDRGTCRGVIAADGDSISGTCGDGMRNWGFFIERQAD